VRREVKRQLQSFIAPIIEPGIQEGTPIKKTNPFPLPAIMPLLSSPVWIEYESHRAGDGCMQESGVFGHNGTQRLADSTPRADPPQAAELAKEEPEPEQGVVDGQVDSGAGSS